MMHPTPPPDVLPTKKRVLLKTTQWISGGIVVGLGVMLIITNPKQEHYTAFATRTVSRFLVRDLCRANDQTPKLFDEFIKNSCQALMARGETEIRAFIAHNTERQDFVLFSLYTTEFPIRPLRVLGIFNQFFLIS